MYYAIYRPYGIRTMSHGDTLIRFSTAGQRQQFLEETGYSFNGIKVKAITRDRARGIFPKAFKSDECECWSDYWADDSWVCDYGEAEMWTGSPTGGNYKYMN